LHEKEPSVQGKVFGPCAIHCILTLAPISCGNVNQEDLMESADSSISECFTSNEAGILLFNRLIEV